jgi:hypothetical protein
MQSLIYLSSGVSEHTGAAANSGHDAEASVILLNSGNRSFKVMNEQTINPYGGLEQPLTNSEGFTAVKKKNPRFK